MKIERELTSKEIGFFTELEDLLVKYNAIIYSEDKKDIYVVVNRGGNCMYNKDISFDKVLDETGVEELFEKSCCLHNKQVKEQTQLLL